MSNRARIKARKRVKKETKPKYKEDVKTKAQYAEEAVYVTKFKSFNIFSNEGENKVVKAPYPMTLDEAMIYFKALAISGNN